MLAHIIYLMWDEHLQRDNPLPFYQVSDKTLVVFVFRWGESFCFSTFTEDGWPDRGLQQCLGRLFGKIVDRKNLL